MRTKRIAVSWSCREYYGDILEVPEDFDISDKDALAQLIAEKADYRWLSSDGIEFPNAVLTAE